MSANQPYTLNIHEDQALLEIVAPASVSLIVLLDSQAEIERIVVEKGIRRVLVDVRRMQTKPSLPELLSFGKGLATSAILRDLRYALVGVSASGLQLQLLRGVTRKLGFDVNLFDSREEAVRWLELE